MKNHPMKIVNFFVLVVLLLLVFFYMYFQSNLFVLFKYYFFENNSLKSLRKQRELIKKELSMAYENPDVHQKLFNVKITCFVLLFVTLALYSAGYSFNNKEMIELLGFTK